MKIYSNRDVLSLIIRKSSQLGLFFVVHLYPYICNISCVKKSWLVGERRKHVRWLTFHRYATFSLNRKKIINGWRSI